MSVILQFLTGLVFGLGLILAGMADPAKVLAFLDLAAIPAGTWDPSLIFVMAGGIAVTFTAYRLILARERPVMAERFLLPEPGPVNGRLLTGAALFGIGWGLAGLCPGPALVSTLTGGQPAIIFIAAMLAGMAMARLLSSATPPLRSKTA